MGLYWDYIRVLLGLYWGYIGIILGGLYWGYIGTNLGLYWGYYGLMGKKMETTISFLQYIQPSPAGSAR